MIGRTNESFGGNSICGIRIYNVFFGTLPVVLITTLLLM